MNNAEFNSKIVEKMNEYVGGGYEISLAKVRKNNGIILDGMTVRKNGKNTAPTLYLNSLYEDYKDGASFGEVFEHLRSFYDKHDGSDPDDSISSIYANIFESFDNIRTRILYKLINAEKNEKLLEDIPHIIWNDLAIVFFYSYPRRSIGGATVLIKNEYISNWNVTIEDLIKCSTENMPKAAPAQLIPLTRMIAQLMGDADSFGEHDVTDEDISNADISNADTSTPMYVLSNRDRMFGAAAMIYSNRISLLAEKLEHNIYVIPSSIHEVILVPDMGNSDPDYLRDTIKEVNETQVEPEEVLSDQLYYYDRTEKKISVLCA